MSTLTPADLAQLDARGIDPAEIQRQLRFFADPPPSIDLVRPCRPGDGIVRLADSEHERLTALWRRTAAAGRLSKFVPASGAATRMFRPLTWYLKEHPTAGRARLEELERQGASDAREALRFIERYAQLPFATRLDKALASRGHDRHELRAAERYEPIFAALLDEDGLGWAGAPKALIDFHRYPDRSRTAFEEHFVEALAYLAVEGGVCRLHFTVQRGHRDHFQDHFAAFRARLEQRSGLRLELRLSVQDPATDTVAVDPDNRPFRLADGGLLLRPGGHGSLLANLEHTGGDLVYVKNIDNVTHEGLLPTTIRWKRLLAGLLVDLQTRLFELLERLEAGSPSAPKEALALLEARYAVRPPRALVGREADLRRWLVDRLDRPLRVCGMVPAAGKPGGGPFWVRDADGGLSGQIVESAQIDPHFPRHRDAIADPTHFNPVDLVCGLRDRQGHPYPLERWIDPAAAFITSKVHETRPLKALERPGLWNGSMAGWNTVFVEVPAETFNPTKTVTDLLGPGHVQE